MCTHDFVLQFDPGCQKSTTFPPNVTSLSSSPQFLRRETGNERVHSMYYIITVKKLAVDLTQEVSSQLQSGFIHGSPPFAMV